MQTETEMLTQNLTEEQKCGWGWQVNAALVCGGKFLESKFYHIDTYSSIICTSVV